MEISLRNLNGDVIAKTIVSSEDFENVNKYTWNRRIDSGNKSYVQCAKLKLTLHQFILGKAPNGQVIDHIDGNTLNNTRENLRFASKKQNSQNSIRSFDKKESVYLGVHKKSGKNSWLAKCGGQYLGSFANEKEAAECYDKYAFLSYGRQAKTNSLIEYDSIKNLTIEQLLNKNKKHRISDQALPKNIRLSKKRYYVQVVYNKEYFKESCKTLEEALNELEKINNFIKEQEEQKKNALIVRDDEGYAILYVKNKDGQIIDTVRVPDDKWHLLVKYSWSKTNMYYAAHINNKRVKLHRFILDAKPNEIVDHINQNGRTHRDNTYENLRINSHVGNAHNKRKKENTSSQYKGVYKSDDRFRAYISKDDIRHELGTYDSEVKAAIAYNIKSKQLYGEYANVNSIHESLYNQYENEVRDVMNTKRIITCKYRGVRLTQEKHWQAQIQKDGIHYRLGTFKTAEEAAIAYNKKAQELYGNNYKFFNVMSLHGG